MSDIKIAANAVSLTTGTGNSADAGGLPSEAVSNGSKTVDVIGPGNVATLAAAAPQPGSLPYQAGTADGGKSPTSNGVDKAIAHLNDYMQSLNRDLQFEVDKKTGKVVVKVIDQKTHQVIQQIPDEVALRLARSLKQGEPLSLLKLKV